MAKDNKMIWLGVAAVILFLLVGGSQLYVIAVPAGALGDVNGDGFIGSIDALMAQNLAVTGEYDPRADADGDGVITVADVQMILSASVGSTTFPTDVIDIPTTDPPIPTTDPPIPTTDPPIPSQPADQCSGTTLITQSWDGDSYIVDPFIENSPACGYVAPTTDPIDPTIPPRSQDAEPVDPTLIALGIIAGITMLVLGVIMYKNKR